MKNGKSLIYGYFGRDNYGDEIMLKEFLEIYKKNISVVVSNELKYKNTKTITYISHSRKLLRFLLILRSNTFIWLGGTCLYSNKGLFSLFLNSFISKIFFNKIIFFGIGIGSVNNKFHYFLIKAVLMFSDSIYFRDINSLEKAKNIYYSSKYQVIPDLVNLFNLPIKKKINNNLIVNITKEYNFNYFENIIDIVNKVNDKVEEIVLLPAELGSEGDIKTLQKIYTKYKSIYPKMRLSCPLNISEINSEILQAKFYIGMRLHLLFVCDLMKIPSIGINYSPKIIYYNNEVGGAKDRIININKKIDLTEFKTVKNIDEKVKKNRQLLTRIINNI